MSSSNESCRIHHCLCTCTLPREVVPFVSDGHSLARMISSCCFYLHIRVNGKFHDALVGGVTFEHIKTTHADLQTLFEDSRILSLPTFPCATCPSFTALRLLHALLCEGRHCVIEETSSDMVTSTQQRTLDMPYGSMRR